MCSDIYALLADFMLVVHAAFVSFVVLGLVLTWIGFFFRWPWVRSWRFRIVHLGAMTVVLAQTIGGRICPLTIWEEQLRQLAGESARYESTFVAHWFHRLMFYDFSETAFQVGYAVFFLLILLTFLVVKPTHK